VHSLRAPCTPLFRSHPGSGRSGRPQARMCLAAGHRGRRHAARTARQAPRLAAGRTRAPERADAGDPRRAGAHRVRLVGRCRPPSRLLCGAHPGWAAGLGLAGGGRAGPLDAARVVRMTADYAELHCLSNFSFQRGASSADELFARAKKHGYQALAITDECTLAGIVRAWAASKAHGIPLIVGSEMQVESGPRLALLVENKTGYQRLCQLITNARRRAEKGSYQLLRDNLETDTSGLLALWLPEPEPDPQHGEWLRTRFDQRLWLAVELHRGPDDAQRLEQLLGLARQLEIPAVASGDVHMHARGRRALQDTLTAIRHHCTLEEAGHRLFPNGERHLRPLQQLAQIYPPALLQATGEIARRCRFDLGDLKYQYPNELVPTDHTPSSWL